MVKNPINILTWNVGNNYTELLEFVLLEVVSEHNIDIVVLQEAHFSIAKCLEKSHIQISYGVNEPKSGVRIFLRKGTFEFSSDLEDMQISCFSCI